MWLFTRPGTFPACRSAQIEVPFCRTPSFLSDGHQTGGSGGDLRDRICSDPGGSPQVLSQVGLYPLVNSHITMERSTIFYGKTHYFYGHF